MNGQYQAYADLSQFLDRMNIASYYFVAMFTTLFVAFILLITPVIAFKITLTNAVEAAKRNDENSMVYAYAKAAAISTVVFLSSTYITEFMFTVVFETWSGIGEIVTTVFFLSW